MRVAVTGAAGFIGSHLCDALLARGDQVVGIDLLTEAYSPASKLANLAAPLGTPGFSFHVEDVRAGRCGPLLQGCAAVVHLAGLGGARTQDLDALWRANATTATAIIDAAATAGVPRVLLASSSSVYGEHPTAVHELSPTAPLSPYGRSKLVTEELAAERAAARGVELVVTRLFSVYGPRQRPDMAFARYLRASQTGAPMPRFMGGSQRRTFTFVTDVVRGMLLALERAEQNAVFNIAGPQSATLNEALDLLHELLSASPVALEDQPSTVREPGKVEADISRARAQLGFQPLTGLPEGLAAQVAAAAGADLLSRR